MAERGINMELKKNQILITISEDKKNLTVECVAFSHPMKFDSYPNKIIQNIGNAIKAYDEETGLSQCITEWTPDGCGYEGSDTCTDCN